MVRAVAHRRLTALPSELQGKLGEPRSETEGPRRVSVVRPPPSAAPSPLLSVSFGENGSEDSYSTPPLPPHPTLVLVLLVESGSPGLARTDLLGSIPAEILFLGLTIYLIP